MYIIKSECLGIAGMVLNKSEEYGLYVTNLRLQKMLFIINVEYLKEHKEELLDFEVYGCCYIVKKVYCTYKTKGRERLLKMGENAQIKLDKVNIDGIIEEYSKYSEFELVDEYRGKVKEYTKIKEGVC